MYRVVPDRPVIEQVAALPSDALAAYTEVLEVLQLTPWNGKPLHEDNPDGAVRCWDFGPNRQGHVVYMVLDEPPEVHPLLVQWMEI